MNNLISRNIITSILIAKVAFFLLVALAYHTLPFSDGSLRANFSYDNDAITLSTAFKTWDGQHYHSISESGYIANHMSSAFYPLYPILISTTAPIFKGNAILAGIVISNIASLVAYALLFAFFRKETNEETALWGTLIMLSYPVAFYTNVLYSEAIFLLLAASLFWSAANKCWLIMFLSALLLPLTRPQGLLIALPFAIYIWHSFNWKIKVSILSPYAITGVFFAIGFGLYLSILHWETGDALSGFTAQKHFISGNSLSNLAHPIEWLTKNFIDTNLNIHGFTDSWLDRLFFVFYFLALFPITLKLKNKGLLTYALVLGLLPALAGSFMSYSRYTLIIFPMFYALASVLRSNSIYLIIIFIPLQALFAIRHCLNYWQG